MFQEFMIYGTQ